MLSNEARLACYMAGKGSDRLQWFFSGRPLFGDPSQAQAFERDRQTFTGFRYVPTPIIRRNRSVERIEYERDSCTVTELRTTKGCLTSRSKLHHPVEYPIKTIADLRVFTEIEAETEILLDTARTTGYHPVVDRISVNPSPIQRLLEYEMGVQGFWYLYQDYPDEVRALLDVMIDGYLHECKLIAGLPVAAVRPVENTSTTMISPVLYKRLSLPQITRMVEVFHDAGKFVAVHMCGLLKTLLPYLGETRMDGIHSLTPPPVGNTSYEMAWEALGDTFRIEGRLGTTCWLGKSSDEILNYLNRLITPERLRRSPFILEVHCDGMTDVPFEQYAEVKKALSQM